MKHAEKVTPISAALTSLATLVCCLPMGFAAAAAAASVGMVVATYQRWLLDASVVLLIVGMVQLQDVRHTKAPPSQPVRSCRKAGRGRARNR